MTDPGTPRRSVQSDPIQALVSELADLRRQVSNLQKASTLHNASTGGAPGNFIAVYDASGAVVARFGALVDFPGEYGLEIKYSGVWRQITGI
jgi:hypothetical protein